MTDVDNESSESEQRRLCADCIGEAFLRAETERLGDERKCDYCGEIGATLTIGELADYVDTAFEHHYRRTATEPTSLESTMMKETDYDWHREGEQAAYAIANAAEIDEEPAEDIRSVLDERHSNFESAQMGEETEFDDEAHYAEKDTDDIEYRENWRYFENSVKTEGRFFSAVAEATLQDVLEGLADHRSPEGKPVIVEAGPDTRMVSLYRARVFQSSEILEAALGRPDLHIGPPPATLAKAGRMNAYGISVFYGATAPEIAIGEVRPPVGSRVVVGEFILLRKVRLLDVNSLRSVYIKGSVFDSTYVRRLERAKFLERLSERISLPVMPEHEPLEYLVTQVIADYLASRTDPALDGILYPSAQGTGGANVMLFHKASRVAMLNLPQGSDIRVWTGHSTEDGWETDYSVWEEVPPSKPNGDEDEMGPFGFPRFADVLSPPFPSIDGSDTREPTRALKIEAVNVHHVTAARYDTTSYPVGRHRSQKGEETLF